MKSYLLLFFLFIIGCSNTGKNTPVNKKEVPSKQPVIKKEIVNEEYANMPLGHFKFNEKELPSYFRGKYNITKTAVLNQYTNDVDTLINFRRGSSIIQFHKNSEKLFLESLNVSDSDFVIMQNNFDIGMNKKDFIHHFGVEKEVFGDSIAVTNKENNSINFIFIKGKLHKMIIAPW